MLFQPPLWPTVGTASSRCPPWSDVKYIRVLVARPRESTVFVSSPRKHNIALETVGEVIHHVRDFRAYINKRTSSDFLDGLSVILLYYNFQLFLLVWQHCCSEIIWGETQSECKQQGNNLGILSKSLYVEGKQKHRGHSDAVVSCWWSTALERPLQDKAV